MLGAHDTVTIWNRLRNPDTGKDEWFRHVLAGCSWEHEAVRAVSGQTASVASVTTVMIGDITDYIPPKEWQISPDKSRRWTARPGDLAALGKHDAEITGIPPNTESALRQSLGPEVFTVRAVQDNTAAYKRGKHVYLEGI